VLIGADPTTDGPGLSAAPVAYLPSHVDARALAAAVHAAIAGLIVLDPTVAGATGVHAHARASNDGESLTGRERQVLLLVAEGLPNKAIARELGISEHTAKFHVGSLLGKLGAGSRTEAVTLATRRGILPV
nr:response regulator transcription factor [Chloroflexia bacterium]